MQNKTVLSVLVAFALFFVCCKKNKSSPTDYTPRMAGVRHWHGVEKFRTASIDSVLKYIDDSFSIIVVNNKEIIHTITGTHLYFDKAWDSILIFSYDRYAGNGQYYSESIDYNFLSNKMEFFFYKPYPLSGYAYTMNLETP